MSWKAHLFIHILVGIGTALSLEGTLPGFPHGSHGAVTGPQVAALEEVKGLIRDLNLEKAEEVFQDVKKDLRKWRSDEVIQGALEQVEDQISALREYKKARKYLKKRGLPKALQCMSKVLRMDGELLFPEEAEKLYSELKGRIYYMINDFEDEESRSPAHFGTTRSGATAEVIRDVRRSADGRHALKVHFDARRPGVREKDPEAYRAVVLEPPDGFSRDIEKLKTLTFSLISTKKVVDTITVDIFGPSASCFAEHPGIRLTFTGQRDFSLNLNRFRFYGGFQWSHAQEIRFSTLGPNAIDIIIDDVKFLR